MTERALSGGCLCGEVRFEVTGPLVVGFACCCTECQKASGSAFSMSVLAMAGDFQVTAGEPRLWMRPGPSGQASAQYACPTCSARTHARPGYSDAVVSIRTGALDRGREVTPAAFFWTREAPEWFEPPEGVLAYETQPADLAEVVAAWRARQA
ncbi:GFA family protein [Phenylobacterium sp. J367]|uniref:GFA family protein n=1 Tax=Phenylobacterium sp. J367 TaxID=2898435 RepID=UPI002151D315|nr:GFA family protein [Phenylobacterium sp. J367]MCR5878197.1 GFA family protein [Phenylobacterium sp. J367]